MPSILFLKVHMNLPSAQNTLILFLKCKCSWAIFFYYSCLTLLCIFFFNEIVPLYFSVEGSRNEQPSREELALGSEDVTSLQPHVWTEIYSQCHSLKSLFRSSTQELIVQPPPWTMVTARVFFFLWKWKISSLWLSTNCTLCALQNKNKASFT